MTEPHPPACQHIDSPDGHRIAVFHWPAKGEARGVVHWLHGMADHASRYSQLASLVNAGGWHLYAHDHRGHGASVVDETLRGHFADQDGWNRVIDDVEQVQKMIRQHHPALPLVLGGHSMGSFIALAFAERQGEGLAGLIQCGSNLHPQWYYRLMRLPIRFERWRCKGRGQSPLLHKLTFEAFARGISDANTDFDWLSNDPTEVKRYMEDPFCGHQCSTETWFQLVSGLLDIHSRERIKALPSQLPVLMIGGDSDPMSNNGKGMLALYRAFHKYVDNKIQFSLYQGGRHEILNDYCREQVLEDVAEWLDGL